MNLNQLRFAQSVARHHSFSRAAEHCHVAQPTLSNGIAQLEGDLGGKLFERTTRSVQLTPFGKHLLSTIERALVDVEEIRALAMSWHHPEHQLVRIGLSPIVDMRLLLNVLAPFREGHPEVEFFFKECFIDDLDQRLSSGQLDLILLPSCGKRLDQQQIELYSEPLLYLPRDGSSLASSDKAISISEAVADELILTMDGCGLRPVTLNLFKESGHAIREYPGQAMSYKTLEDWVSLGIGGGILPRSKISSNNRLARPLLLDSGEPATVRLQLLWQPNVRGGAHLEALTEFLNTEGRKLARGIAA